MDIAKKGTLAIADEQVVLQANSRTYSIRKSFILESSLEIENKHR